jgi:hypothetical protein
VSQILGVSPADVSAGYEQITNDRAAAAAATAAAASNASSNTGLLNSFDDYDLYDRRYGDGEGQRV